MENGIKKIYLYTFLEKAPKSADYAAFEKC